MRTLISAGLLALATLAHGQPSLPMLWMRGGMPLQVRNVAVSPIDDMVVIGGENHGLFVYRLSTGLLERFVPTPFPPGDICFSPNRQYLATRDGVWRVSDWTPLWRSSLAPSTSVFSPDSEQIAIALYDPVVQICRVRDGALLRELPCAARVVFVGFTPDGQRLVTLDVNGQVRLWRVSDGVVLNQFTLGLSVNQLRASLSPDGEWLAMSGFQDGRVRVVRVADGSVVAQLTADGSQYRVAFSPDGALLATCADRQGVRVHLWRTNDWRLLYAPFYPYEQPNQSVVAMAFSRDGRYLLCGNAEIAVWDVAQGTSAGALNAHRQEIAPLQFAPDSRTLYSSTRERGKVYAWNARTGAHIATLIVAPQQVESFSVNPSRGIVATGYRNATRLWELPAASLWMNLAGQDPRFAPDGNRLYTFHSDVGALGWRLVAEGVLFERAFALPNFVSGAVSPDGRFVALLGRERSAVWRADTGEAICALPPVSWIDAFAFFSPGGRYLSYTRSSQTAFVYWNIPEGTGHVIQLSEPGLHISAAAFTPDEQFAVVVDSEQRLRLFRLSNGEEFLRFAPLSLQCYRLLFSEDGKLLALSLEHGIVGVARNPLFPDIDGDGSVDDHDLLRVLFRWGATGEQLPEDVNYDGVIDDGDLLMVLFYFGQ